MSSSPIFSYLDECYQQPLTTFCLHLGSDYTGSNYLTAFDDQAKMVLGVSADELWEMHQIDETNAQAVWQKSLFQTFVFKVRAKNERYNDNDRVKCSVMECSPVNFKDESSKLLETIRKYGIAS